MNNSIYGYKIIYVTNIFYHTYIIYLKYRRWRSEDIIINLQTWIQFPGDCSTQYHKAIVWVSLVSYVYPSYFFYLSPPQRGVWQLQVFRFSQLSLGGYRGRLNGTAASVLPCSLAYVRFINVKSFRVGRKTQTLTSGVKQYKGSFNTSVTF